MPRRDQLSEKKKERLMQEHEQLQKLMLQARSSVRRSSLKDHPEADVTPPQEVENTDRLPPENESVVPTAVPVENNRETIAATAPLTEQNLFPVEELLNDSRVEPQPLTERDLFPESDPVTALPRQPEESLAIKVIRPKEHTAPIVAPVFERTSEPAIAREAADTEAPAPEPRYFEPAEERSDAYEAAEMPARTRSKTGWYIAALVAALAAGFGGYYLYTNNQDKTTTVAKQHTEPASKPVSQTSGTALADAATEKASNGQNKDKASVAIDPKNETSAVKPSASGTEQGTTETPATEKPFPDERKSVDNVSVVKKPATEPLPVASSGNNNESTAAPNPSLGKYKVISKAYFHNEPDEGTRRKAFIIHWNNAVLTPIEEKNGFVYIVFTNHLGQTSKGWLRKQDLRRLE